MGRNIEAPGLRWRSRASGARIPVWIASNEAAMRGYPVKTVNLTGLTDREIVARCHALQAEMKAWVGGRPQDAYDGTLGSLIRIYQTHEESGYQRLKPSSRIPYDVYLRRIHEVYGRAKIERLTGLDLRAWHKDMRAPDAAGGREKLGAAEMGISVLKAVFSFGLVAGIRECEHIVAVARELRLPGPKARDVAPTADEVELARAAAHRLGHPRAALAYALQFETMARQWDIIGQWVPLDDPRPSAVIRGRLKWIGPTWAAIDERGVLKIKPTKTEGSTGATIHVDLSGCQMVMAELAQIPGAERVGPLVTFEGAPYPKNAFDRLWRRVRKGAGLPDGMWNRDLRAGGVTEAQIAGASAEDRAKLAGHSKRVNEQVYARDRLAASGRVVELRAKLRSEK